MWKAVENLKKPFNDAVNYRQRHEKEFFNKIFLATSELNQVLDHSIYFLIGEKGSGKTAYATYLENNTVADARCRLVAMTETQYKRFVELKNDGKLTYSDYANIWRFILLIVCSQVIVEKSKSFFTSVTGKFEKIEGVISKWNKDGLNPEIDVALEAMRQNAFSGGVEVKEVVKFSAEHSRKTTESRTLISHNLLEGELSIKQAIQDLKLRHDHVIFVDGIDFRPASVSYPDYLECVKGLGEAIWQLNTEYFRNIKDSKGRIKIVLLVRPDVFHKLNLYNSNSRIQDNCVYLEWATTEKTYLDSNLYHAAAKYFSSQQSKKMEPGDAWVHYFPNSESFKRMLRTSFQKPRDILTFIKILRDIHIKRRKGSVDVFDESLLADSVFTKESSDYLLGEVRNYASFYMTPDDFSAYLKYFQYLDGKSSFDMPTFVEAYKKFHLWIKGEKISAREYFRDADALLQFFYDVNVIGYKEDLVGDKERFFHFSFRERSLNNLAPKVKAVQYLMINPGISKALDIGKEVTSSRGVAEGKGRRAFKRRGRGTRGKRRSPS